MSRDTEILEKLGQEVAATLGDGPSEERRIIQRRDFLAVVSADNSRRRRWVLATAGMAALLAVVLTAVVITNRRSSNVTFWIGEDGVEGVEGQWIQAEASVELPIHFEGGSEISLASDASAKMARATKKEIRMDLASGSVHCNINKNKYTKWHVVAGPYTVTVTGTVFNVDWEPGSGSLNVNVERGSVLVSGADLSEHGVRLAVGDHLHVDGEKAFISLRGDTGEEEQAEVEERPSTEALPEMTEMTEKDRRDTADSQSIVRKKGVSKHSVKTKSDRLDPDRMSLDDLWQAASKARYNRDAATAERLLSVVKRRFPRSRQAQSASFLMGRIQLELRGNAAGSVKWFRRYLSENPSGPLAEEAFGRIIGAYKKAGQQERARQQAKRYLSRYENGLFDDLAKSMIAE